MAKIIILTAAALAAGAQSLAAAIAANPVGTAAEILLIQADYQKTIEDLNVKFNDLEKVNAQLEASLESAEIVQPVVEASKPVLSDETFTVDKQVYGFAFPALKYGDKVITNDDVLADKNLQKELVAMGSGFIVKK